MPLFATILLVAGLASRGLGQESFTKRVGSRVTIPSNFVAEEGKSLLTVSWRFGSQPVVMVIANKTTYLHDYAKRAVITDDYSLILDKLEIADTGVYEFETITPEGSNTSERTLQVFASPTVSARAMPVVDEGDGEKAVLAKCFAIGGSPPYTIEWYENDMVVEDGVLLEDNRSGPNEELVDATLILKAVPNAASDNGRRVTCAVRDALGESIDVDVYLQVTAYPMIVKFPHSPNITLVMEKKKILNCQATGVPAPKVTWYKGDKELKYGIGESRLPVIASDYSKSGQYRCVASNVQGTVSEELWLDVQGSPTVSGAEDFPNKTENVVLKSEEEYVRLMCESDARPRPAFTWEVEGKNLTELDLTKVVVVSEDRTTAYVNISSRHFRGVSIGTKVSCVAENEHGTSAKNFLVSIPEIVPSNAGVVAGVIVSVIILIAIVVLIIYIALAKRQQGSMTTSPETGGPCAGWSACCGSGVKSKELKEEDDIVTVEHVKEVSEEGTHEEKQKLTEAEEKPANEEEEKKDEEEAPKEEEEENKAEDTEAKEEPVKTKTKVGLPLQCCRGKKKKQVKAEEEPKAEEEEKETGNGDAKELAAGEEKETRENDRDSGKGDTLEKVIEEDETQK